MLTRNIIAKNIRAEQALAQGRAVVPRQATQKMLEACVEKNIDKLREALADGADVTAYEEKELNLGKTALHIAAKMSFLEGVVLLRAYGADVNVVEREHGNTALHLVLGENNTDMSATLLDMGASLFIENSLGYSPLQQAMPWIAKEGKEVPSQDRRSKNALMAEHYLNLPYEEQLEGLTLQEAFRERKSGYSLMDNPRMLLRIQEVGAALKKSGTPLTLEALKQTGNDGKCSYLEKLMKCNRLGDALKVLSAEGEQLGYDDVLQKDGSLTELAQTAGKWGQMNGLFCVDNWRGQPEELYKTLRKMPQEAREQILNLNALKAQVPEGKEQQQGFSR